MNARTLSTSRTITAIAAAGLVGGLFATAAPATAGVPDLPAPVIVTFDDSVADPAVAAADQLAGLGIDASAISQVYEHVFPGYAASVPASLIATLSADALVDDVSLDTPVTLSTTQTGATWGLDRTDQRNLPLDGAYTYGADGAGVDAYIIDSGIRQGHSEFTGRIGAGFDANGTGSVEDCNGHGTHVAGTTAGTTYGVAKKATIIPVRVFSCAPSSSSSVIIAGIDWAAGHHQAGDPAVANLSLGGGANNATDNAVQALIDDGITVAVAAGNGDAIFGNPEDACGSSPARLPAALTVGASDNQDKRASFSNNGPCVDLFGPGVNITSAGTSGNSATATMSGTSMASPHVAGVAAQYLSLHPSATPAQVGDALLANATDGAIAPRTSCGLFGCGGGLFGGGGNTTTTKLLFSDF